MTTNVTADPWRRSLAWSAVFRAGRLFLFGFLGWLWFVAADDSAWRAVSLVAVLAHAGLTSITWYALRARAERRWRAALDRYAEREEAKWTHSRRGHQRVEGDGHERHP